jgi:hypothetical protein
MVRVVRGADGRDWVVRSRVNWVEPASGKDFEHDVAEGYAAGIVMLMVVLALVLTVVFWTPPGVVVPGWFVVLFLCLLLVLPIQWATGRSRTIVAETPGTDYLLPERWVGTTHGIMISRQHVNQIVRSLRRTGVPDEGQGRLQPVN